MSVSIGFTELQAAHTLTFCRSDSLADQPAAVLVCLADPHLQSSSPSTFPQPTSSTPSQQSPATTSRLPASATTQQPALPPTAAPKHSFESTIPSLGSLEVAAAHADQHHSVTSQDSSVLSPLFPIDSASTCAASSAHCPVATFPSVADIIRSGEGAGGQKMP